MLPLSLISVESCDPDHKMQLTKPSETVLFPLSSHDLQLIEAMQSLLLQLGGVGLAAPQVGYNKKIIAIYIPIIAAALRQDAEDKSLHVMLNPTYVALDQHKKSDFEACYSVHSTMGKIRRFQSIQVTYQDETGQPHQITATGFYARVLQHEIDHLEGILITDRLQPGDPQGSHADMLALRRSELSPEQRTLFDQQLQQREAKMKEN